MKDAKGRMDDMNDKIQNAQKKGKIDLGKLSEYQQERDTCSDKCRKFAEECLLMYESLSREFTATCFDELSNYVGTYETYFKEGSEIAAQTASKRDTWKSVATEVKSHISLQNTTKHITIIYIYVSLFAKINEEREKKVSQLTGNEKIVMANGMLQLLANTEQQYISKLKTITHTFLGSIMKDGALLNEISKEELNTIFGAYKVLLDHHQDLLQRLAATQSAGATFNETEVKALFSTYRTFISAFSSAEETLYACRKRSRVFAKKVKAIEADSTAAGGEELSELMCIPLMRIGEYIAALESIATQSKPPLPAGEAREVRSAAKVLGELAEALAREESAYRVKCVVKNINGCPEALCTHHAGRRVVAHASVMTGQGQGEAFLFSDVLVVVRKALTLIPGFGKKKYNYLCSFKLAHVCIRGIRDDAVQGIRNGIEISDIIAPSLAGSSSNNISNSNGNSNLIISDDMSLSSSSSSLSSSSTLLSLSSAGDTAGSGNGNGNGASSSNCVYLGFESDEERRGFVDKICALRAELEASRVFGVSLDALMASPHERGREVPRVLEDTICNLDSRGLGHEGLFRISGGKRELEEIREALDAGCPVDFNSYPIHTVAGTLKLWLRSLPEPLLTASLCDEFASATRGRSAADGLHKIEALVARLPKVNRACLARLILFLARVAEHSAENKMRPSNLSIVFSPPLLHGAAQDTASDPTAAAVLSFANASYDTVAFMIEHSRNLFGDVTAKPLPATPQRRLAVKAPLTGNFLDIDVSEDLDNNEGAAVGTAGGSGSAGTAETAGTLGDGGGEVTLSLRDIIKQGPLQKAREKWGATSNEQRWIIVKKGWLYNFHSQKDKKGDVYSLAGAGVREAPGKPLSFVLSLPAAGEEITFSAKTADDLTSWLIAINTCIV